MQGAVGRWESGDAARMTVVKDAIEVFRSRMHHEVSSWQPLVMPTRGNLVPVTPFWQRATHSRPDLERQHQED
jgi:hypothetical protein